MTDPGLADRRETWTLEFARPDGTGGFARLSQRAGLASYWAALVAPPRGPVMASDDGLAAPRHPQLLVVRGDGLWAELVEETRGEHWSAGLEAFGVGLDDPLDAERGARGERLPIGFDLEWETGVGEFGEVHGDLLVARDRLVFDGTGRFAHEVVDHEPGREESRRLSWQRRPDGGHTAHDDDVLIDVDARGLPAAARVGSLSFLVAAVVVLPFEGRLTRALVVGEAGCGWLDWYQPQRDVRCGSP